MESDLRQKLVDIKDELTEIIPQLEWELEETSICELKEARIVIWSKIQELDLVNNE
jgi:hypothetical protein